MKKDKSKINRLKNHKRENNASDYFRNIIFVSSQFLEEIPETQSLWYETQEEIEQKLQWGKEKAHLLQWVRKQMERKLTPKEKKYIEYYHFQGKTLETIAKKFQSHPANVHRIIRRGIKKLIQLTKNENLIFHFTRMKKRKNTNKN